MQELSPQPNSESVMGAAVYDTPRQVFPPILVESAAQSPLDMGQLMAMLAGMESRMRGDLQAANAEMKANTQGMKNEIKASAQSIKEEMKNNMDTNMQTLRGEMQDMVRPADEHGQGEK